MTTIAATRTRPSWLDLYPDGEMTRFVTKCSKCKRPHAMDVYAPWASQFYAETANGPKGEYIRCECGRGLTQWRQVQGRYSEGHKCDARCTGARGHDCECQCAGQNHGADNL